MMHFSVVANFSFREELPHDIPRRIATVNRTWHQTYVIYIYSQHCPVLMGCHGHYVSNWLLNGIYVTRWPVALSRRNQIFSLTDLYHRD